jgi:hypothetical protein
VFCIPGGILIVFSLSAFDEHTQGLPAAMCRSQEVISNGTKEKNDSAVYKDGIGGNDVRRDLEIAWRQLYQEGVITQVFFAYGITVSV